MKISSFVLSCLIFLLSACERQETSPRADYGRSVSEALGGGSNTEGFARAISPRVFDFPSDHGPHPGFRNEWWYFTGNLETANGRRFGYQLTFFRIALAPLKDASESEGKPSRWRTQEVYMGHLGVSDATSGRHLGFERFGRAAAGLAGARLDEQTGISVWLDHWSMDSQDLSTDPVRLRVAEGDVFLDLELTAEKPIVLNGDNGLSQKSEAPGNASYYYSITRLSTRGRIGIGDEEFVVSGNSWFDREWSTSALSEDQAGWDWFAMQLDDGRDLMLYRLRLKNGEADPSSAGTLVASNGDSRRLTLKDMSFETKRHWTSGDTGRTYPVAWRIELPNEELILKIEPLFDEQEMRLGVRYWEGAIQVTGEQAGQAVSGRGYMELAGYGDAESGVRK